MYALPMLQLMMCTSAPPLGPIGSKMTSYWDFTESSGNRADSVGSNTAVPSAALGSVTGPRGGGDLSVDFTGSSQLNAGNAASTRIDISSPSTGGSHCMFGWVYAASTAAAYQLAGVWDGLTSSGLAYLLDIETGSAYGYNGGSTYYFAGATISASAWHFVVMWRDAADGKVRFCIDNGSVQVSGSASTPVALNTNDLTFGGNGATGALYLNGSLSRFGWIKGNFLTTSEITTMYNGGPSGALNWADIVSGGL